MAGRPEVVPTGAERRAGAGGDSLAGGAAAVSADTGAVEPLPLTCALRALFACAWRVVSLVCRGRVRQPAVNVGRRVAFADGSSAEVYRETVIDRRAPGEPVVLVVGFRLRWIRRNWQHGLFRLESELNTVLFAGFPGLVSKLWLRHDQHGLYRGLYQWDGGEEAVSYVRALWWVLAPVSEPGSVRYAVLPGLDRDAVLRNPGLVDSTKAVPGGWWRPVTAPPAG